MTKKGSKRVIFIAPTASQPRYHKRVAQLSLFCDVTVFAFHRGYYEENTFPSFVPFHSLGHVKDGKYLLRIHTLFSAVQAIRRSITDRSNCLFYAMSLDCLAIAKLCGIRRGFYEIGDLRQAEGLGKVFSIMEKILFRDLLGLALTSKYFYEEFYKDRGLIPKSRVYFLENKLNRTLVNKRPKAKDEVGTRIIIGIIGLLRYPRPLELLLKFVKERPDSYVIECFGDGPSKSLVETYLCQNISYHGSFKNPDDLTKIYSRIDLNYVVYDASTRNVRLAIPNKIYESAFFGVPIVCSEGTYVAKMAENWGIGRGIRTRDMESFSQDMGSIDQQWVMTRSLQCLKIPESDLLDNGDEVVARMLVAQERI